jgi:hypothetical protein
MCLQTLGFLLLLAAHVGANTVQMTSEPHPSAPNAGTCDSEDTGDSPDLIAKKAEQVANNTNHRNALGVRRSELDLCKELLLGPVIDTMDVPATANVEMEKHALARCLYSTTRRNLRRRGSEDASPVAVAPVASSTVDQKVTSPCSGSPITVDMTGSLDTINDNVRTNFACDALNVGTFSNGVSCYEACEDFGYNDMESCFSIQANQGTLLKKEVAFVYCFCFTPDSMTADYDTGHQF